MSDSVVDKPQELYPLLYGYHGGPYDRGCADSYYRRGMDPHYYKNGSVVDSPRIGYNLMTGIEIAAYKMGYADNEKLGDWKSWS